MSVNPEEYWFIMAKAIMKQLLDLALTGISQEPITCADTLESAQRKIQNFLQSRSLPNLNVLLNEDTFDQLLQEIFPTQIKQPEDEKIMMIELSALAKLDAYTPRQSARMEAITEACDATNRTLGYTPEKGWYTEPKPPRP